MDGEMNMPSIASVSEGDANTIPEDLPKDYFPPNFKDYMLKEQLNWSRDVRNDPKRSCSDFGWVFWSKQDHDIEPSLSLGNCANFNPNNIRLALKKQMVPHSITMVELSLVQFWAPRETLEGRIRLTTQFHPFALGPAWSTIDRQKLCEYRMKMCSGEYNNCFYVDSQSGEEQLGLPGRVFLRQFPEFTPDVEYYTTKEYPQRELALRCKIEGSWALPVFENSSQTCVGVLEIVCLYTLDTYRWRTSYYLANMQKKFQDFGLQFFIGGQACMRPVNGYQARENELCTIAKMNAYQELRKVLRSVCKFHKLPLAMTWVPCSDCNGLRRPELRSGNAEFCKRTSHRSTFLEVSKWSHLRKGLVSKRALSTPNMLYCSNISKLSLDEYPLVPYARMCKFSGWFTIWLQNVNTGNDIYVLEFFFSARNKDNENILTTLNFILGTMEKNFKTFRLASGKELGELMSLEVIYFQDDQKIQFVQSIQATRDFSRSSIQSSVQSSPSVANTGQGLHDANMVTSKAKYDLNCDPCSDSDSSSDSDPSFMQSSTRVANARPRFQDADLVTIKAKYASTERVLKLSLPCRLVELQEEVDIWLAGTYHVGYKDEEDGFVLIACDEDLQAYIDDSISQGNTSPMVLLEPKEPATNFVPNN